MRSAILHDDFFHGFHGNQLFQTNNMKQRPEFIVIGIIARAHGLKGEVLVEPMTDELHQFKKIKHLYLRLGDEQRKLFSVQRARIKNDQVILKLTDIDDRNSADVLQGSQIERSMDECEALSPNEYYVFDLIGLKVKTTANQWLGEVTDVLTLPANDVYVITAGSRELLIPAIKDIVKKIDLEAAVMIIEPIDGLL